MRPTSTLTPVARADQTLSWNMKLLAHHELAGFGGMGEGMGMQRTRDGRRILWLAHESAPKNFTGVDVTDPRAPKVIVQTDLPHAKMRSNSLDVVGDVMAVAYQTSAVNIQPAGFDLFDVSEPERPQRIAHFDASGPHSRGVHALWFVDGEYIHLSGGAADFKPRDPKDDQFYRIIDVRKPAQPQEVGRWWLPGTRDGDDAPPPERLPAKFDAGFRAHNTNVYPERPDRCYLAYIDGGIMVLDISDRARPKLVSRWTNSPPYHGFPHRAAASRRGSGSRATSGADGGADWPKSSGCSTRASRRIRCRSRPSDAVLRCIRQARRALRRTTCTRTARADLVAPENIVIGSFFNAGVRAYDVSNPYQPQEVAYFVPGAPKLSPVGAIQLNDVYVDDRGIVFTVDRFAGGLYVLEMTV
jgi:hypothetical protein